MEIIAKEKQIWNKLWLNVILKLIFLGLFIFCIISIPSLGIINLKVEQVSQLAFLYFCVIVLFFISIASSFWEGYYWENFIFDFLSPKLRQKKIVKWLYISLFSYLIGSIFRIVFLIGIYFEDGYYQYNFKLARRRKYGFSIQDIAFAGILFSLFLIISLIKNFTVARIINLDFEYVFYILFAYFFGKFKGSLLSFMADFFGLLFAGRIGFYHWVYAIVPIITTIMIGFIIDLFKKNQNKSMIVMNVALIVIFAILIYVFSTQVNDPKGIKISKTFGVSRISLVAGIILMTFAGVFISILIGLSIYYLKTKNDSNKKNRIGILILSFFLTVSIIVVARWIWGPFAFIRYANFYLGRNYIVKDYYLVFMTPIVIRSLISIPIYIVVLFALLVPLSLIKKHYAKKEAGITY
ncbi:uncharacterized protein DUF3816 [Mycoplasmopsis mustelae]|uniref:Uncharacterized protein DUF3816 n=1 Tax=Mycoplasmopsis mustelae TaxID=171289 RepID=A0A4R7UES3_9BACT|nr:ECF transporter S component [Mycoplasmopsis mustelae]TDV24134.1 uncharacterized protein DUF3816 [Mycoplasmopsis mustelae]